MQEDLMYCVSRSYLESDKKLNIEYRKRMKILKGIKKEKLLAMILAKIMDSTSL
jgi:uncharacterized protein YecT (DUF1311 family)